MARRQTLVGRLGVCVVAVLVYMPAVLPLGARAFLQLERGGLLRRLSRPHVDMHLHRHRRSAGQSTTDVHYVEALRSPSQPFTSTSDRPWFAQCLSTLAAIALCTVAALGAPGQAIARETDIYFGTGNFFHLQHEFVMKEELELGRRAGDITSTTGYAGGTQAGNQDRLCFSSLGGSPDYKQLGHTQVVRLTLPDAEVADFARLYFEEVPKRKVLEKGAEYRSVIGLRGGMKSRAFPLVEEANNGRYRLVEGAGNDPGTDGSTTVYVYDAKKFPFRPAELVNQFANDPPDTFTKDYRGLNDVLKGIGSIFSTGCPEVRI